MRLGNIGQPLVKDDTNILEIKIPKEMEKAIPTGHAHIDRLFAGDGVIAGTVTLVTGGAGAGKSTLMQDLFDKLTGHGYTGLYITGEESLYQLRRVAKRLRLRNGFLVDHNAEAQSIIERCERLRKKFPRRKLFLCVDSLQCIRLRKEEGRKGRPLSDEKQSLVGLQLLTEYAKNNWIPIFIIGHVNKKGDFAGRQTIKHIVDCHLHLSLDIDVDTGMEERVLEMKKNRFGPAGVYFAAEMTERGLAFREDTSSFSDEDETDV